MKRITSTRLLAFLVASLALGATGLQAETQGPDQLVKEVTTGVIKALEDNAAELKSSPDTVYEIVDTLVLPHFDFKYMSQLVLARHWRTASDEQKERFTKVFRNLLVKTYATSLADFSGEEVSFPPFRAPAGADDVTVPMEIIPQAGPALPLDYSLHQIDGVWKVYDVNIDGLSLVTNYRRSFGKDIKEKGLDGLIAQVEAKQNR